MSAVAALSGLKEQECATAAPRLAYVAIAAWWGFLFLYGIDAGELWRNEGLRARIAQEMLADGDWIVPHLHGEPIFTKPPFLYWAICVFSLPFGAVSVVTARLPSVFAGFGTSLLLCWVFQRSLGKQAGILAALMTPCCIFW